MTSGSHWRSTGRSTSSTTWLRGHRRWTFPREPVEILMTNSLGTYNLINLALAKKARFLMASTSECYGDPRSARSRRPTGAT